MRRPFLFFLVFLRNNVVFVNLMDKADGENYNIVV